MKLKVKGVKKPVEIGHSAELTLLPVDEITIKVFDTKGDRKIVTINVMGGGLTVTCLDAVLLLPQNEHKKKKK